MRLRVPFCLLLTCNFFESPCIDRAFDKWVSCCTWLVVWYELVLLVVTYVFFVSVVIVVVL